MSNFNRVILLGNITRDPELRSTPGGKQVCDISVAVNETWQDQSQTTQERTTFVDVTCWGKLAEMVCRWKKKGDPVLVEGALAADNWTDKETGKKRSKLKVVAARVVFTGKQGGEAKPAPADPQESQEAEEYATEMPRDDSYAPPY